jgi:hypothetical protein
LSTSPDWTAEGNQVGAEYGIPVATAGDVNGDGYGDAIVGAHLYDSGQTDEGRAFIYHGSPSGLSTSPDWTAEGDQAGAEFGVSVATAGDVNGDGYSDAIVGAHLYDSDQTDEGRAFVYHGGAIGLNSSPDWTAEGNQAGAEFGISVATAGDVNGDGYSDVIVGAPHYHDPETDEGRAFVHHGSASGLSTSPDWTAESNQALAELGNSVAAAGDVNGDGYGDVIVGAYNYSNVQWEEGWTFVYHGSASGLSTSPEWTAESNQQEAWFGWSVATAGDVNGDGYSDVVVGAHYYDHPQAAEGRAYVYHGSSAGLAISPDWTAEGDQAQAYFGFSVATAGDVNGDGYSDVIVGAPPYDNGETNEGRVYVYHGSVTGIDTSPDRTAEGDQADAHFGHSVATAGDVNGDGYSDVIVGAPYYHNPQTEEGRVYVYHGSATGLNTSPNWTAEGDQAWAWFGWSVSAAGDVNGDGYGDAIVGACLYDNPESGEGEAFVYHGSATGLSTSPDWTAGSNQDFARFGQSVATAGDVNGDGYGDVIVGAPYYHNPEPAEGRAYVYHGGPTGLNTPPAWTAESNQAGAEFGISVATAGDVNGDGYSDVIVGAHLYDSGQTDEGRAFVYHGGATGLNTSPDWTAESNQGSAELGNSVATAGDLNGDGYSDVIVGARYYDNGQTNEGWASVYHGSTTGLSISPDWAAESDQAGARFGESVATAGDVNGDGFSDVIVGALLFDNGQTDEGRAYAYCGNEGGGLDVLPRQYRTDLVTPVVPALKTRSQSQAGLGLYGRTFFGRNDLRVQFELKPLGAPFDGAGLVTTGWMDPGTAGAAVSEVIGGLIDRTIYRWRARVGYRLSDGAPQPYGRWIYQPYGGGLGEADFQVSDDDLPPNVPNLHITRLSATQCRLWWHPVAGAAQGYYLYRGTAAYFEPSLFVMPWASVAAPDTVYDFSGGVGDPATNYYFLSRSVGAWGLSGNSNRVGEFDVGTATPTTRTAGRLE